LDRFFDQWVYHPRHPDLKLSYQWMPQEKLAKVTIQQTQKVDDDVLLYHFPSKLRFIVDGQPVDQEIEVTAAEETFFVALDSQPSVVRFDPEYTVLADITFDKSDELLKAQLENHDDMVGRLIACQSLANRKTQASAELLAKALNQDPFFGVRIAAAEALVKHGSDEAFAAMEQSWSQQDDARVRLAVVRPMLNRYTAQTPALIAAVLQREQNPAIQAVAIKALGRFHGEQSREQILRFLQTPSFRHELAVAAIEAIREQHDPAYAAPLMASLKQHEREFASRDFAQALSALAHVARLQEDKEAARTFLSGYVNDPKEGVRVAAIGALGKLGDPKALALLSAFADSSDTRLSRAAKQASEELNAVKPTTPTELIELRKTLEAIQQENKKFKSQLETIQQQIQARESTVS